MERIAKIPEVVLWLRTQEEELVALIQRLHL
jgi:hypothetical protein